MVSIQAFVDLGGRSAGAGGCGGVIDNADTWDPKVYNIQNEVYSTESKSELLVLVW
jgi:hypothetical protein